MDHQLITVIVTGLIMIEHIVKIPDQSGWYHGHHGLIIKKLDGSTVINDGVRSSGSIFARFGYGQVFQAEMVSPVKQHVTMENHQFSWENPLFLWPFSIAMLVYQRVWFLHEKHSLFLLVRIKRREFSGMIDNNYSNNHPSNAHSHPFPTKHQ